MDNQEILSNIDKKYVFTKLHYLLKKEDVSEVVIMVAFITIDGIYLILNELRDLLDKNIKVVIITGFMNNFNSPKTLNFLTQIKGLEVRIANINGYHPKVYIIKTNNYSSHYIIGSSNLTNSALRRNIEANIYIEHTNDHLVSSQINELYQQIYAHSEVLTSTLLNEYSQRYEKPLTKNILDIQKVFEPNAMQQKALVALSQLRKAKQNKALIISATGSGKTYLSAFDVKAFKAKRLLFIVHRESILNSAIQSYTTIFPKLSIGKLTGTDKELNADYLFASVQSLHKDEYLYQFAIDYFDYIIIDEAHRIGAASYQKILSYFRPQFTLGMTATPERSDNFDIYKSFDNNIAYEIRLNEALQEDLICPFHYFGISELAVNDDYLEDYSNFNQVNYNERVKHIIDNLKLYGHDGDKVHGLIFTSRIEEAIELSRLFNQYGYKTISLSGANSDHEREKALQLLANENTNSEYLDYIFSVDIFNEGIDIPTVNQIVLLRPTQSAIVFVQQIGRGLRKSPTKNYCVILDFIGNYSNSFNIAVALSGNNGYDKEELRSFIYEANTLISTQVTISFDRITREQIYNSINSIQINRKFINHNYIELKKKLNRIPDLIDFKNYNSIDPKIIFRYQNKSSKILFNNYYELLHNNNDHKEQLDNQQLKYLDYITQELLFAARPDEMYVLLNLINDVNNIDQIYTNLHNKYNTLITKEKQVAIYNILTLETSNALQKKYSISLLAINPDILQLNDEFNKYLNQKYFKSLIIQTLELGLSYFNEYKQAPKYNDLILYNKYSRKELVRLLNVNLSMETSIYGYRIIANKVPIFITYNKISANKINAKYTNIFLNSQDIIWYSRPYGHTISNEVSKIIDYRKNNLTIMIFLKKSDNEGSEYYYLGNADIHNYIEETLDNKNVIKCILRLKNPVVDSYFDYFTS